MAKLSLLQIVQSILNDMDSDEINSINDTIESQQIASIVKDTYYQIINGETWPHLKKIFQLDHSGLGTAYPTYLKLPEDIVHLEWIKYNNALDLERDKYEEVKYKTPIEFLEETNVRNSLNSNITVITDTSGIKINVYNDRKPQYWTSFDDVYIVMDAYNTDADSTLQNSKTQCYGLREPTFTLLDGFIPDLPIQAFSYLLAESKAACFMHLRQSPNAKAEQHSMSQRRRMSTEKWRAKGGITFPNYGRK